MFGLCDWENVCLVCLQTGVNRCVFGEYTDSNVIADKIMKCSDILIKSDTNQPRNICLKCLDDLNVSYKFRQNYEQSESVVHTLLNTNPQEFEIRNLGKTSITVNPTLDIFIKGNNVDDTEVNDTCEHLPCLNLEDEPDTKAKFVFEDYPDACDSSNGKELNHVKASQSYKTKKETNCEISKRPRGRPKKLTAEESLKSKASKHIPQKTCKICGRSFKFQNKLDSHMRRHNNERPFRCEYCDKAFVTAKELRCHVKVHTGQKPLKCRHCDRRFSNYSSRKTHESTHTSERPFICPTCGKSFGHSKGLTRHIRTHTDVKKFVCSECGRGFTRQLLFEKHVSNHVTRVILDKSPENKEEKRLETEHFQIEENANADEINIKHEIVENDNDNYDGENTTCFDFEDGPINETKNKKPTQQLNKEIPKGIRGRPKNTEASPTICQICNRSLKDQRSLDVHMRRHNDERPFNCVRCDKAFVTAQELQWHMRVHTGQKPLKCQYCDRRFSDYRVKKNHESTHTGERPYVCPTCGKSFGYSKALRRHLRTHTNPNNVMYKACDKELPKEVLFEEHIACHLSRNAVVALGKSFEHNQDKPLEKEVFQIEENEINIKHEIMENAVIDETCNDRRTSCFGNNSSVTKAKNDKIILQTNEDIPKRSRGRPKNARSNLKVCTLCNRDFKDQTEFNAHMRRHNNERPFSCDHCDKPFVTRAELQCHVRVHTGQKPLKCQYCDQRFSDYGVRKNHESTHTGERPYACPTCGKTFGFSKGLTKHIRTHASVSKFVNKKGEKEVVKNVLFEKHIAHHLIRDEFDKSSEHKQIKWLEKHIDQTEACTNSNEIDIKCEVESFEEEVN